MESVWENESMMNLFKELLESVGNLWLDDYGRYRRKRHSDFDSQYIDDCALTWVREHRKEQYLGRNIIVQFENIGVEVPAIDIRIHLIHLGKD